MKNWSIGSRIIAGFGVVIATAMALGIFAHSLVGTIESSSTEITAYALPGLYTIAQLQGSVQKNFSLLLTAVGSKDRREVERVEGEIRSSRASNTNVLAEHEKTIRSQKDRELYENMKAARTAYSAALESVMKLKQDTKDQAAVAALNGELRPAYSKYIAAMAELMAYRKSFSDEKSKAIADSVAMTRRGIAIGMAAALLIAVFITWVIVPSITRPLATAGSLIGSVSMGDLSVRADVTSIDEFGQMTAALNKMAENLKSSAAVAMKISEGDLSVSPNVLSEKDSLGHALTGMLENLDAAGVAREDLPRRPVGFAQRALRKGLARTRAHRDVGESAMCSRSGAEDLPRGPVGQPQALSEKDSLGIALVRMVENLNGAAHVAVKIAEGDLTVEAKALSERDILGQALVRMLENLRKTVTEVTAASGNVAAGSTEMSTTSQQLSQGASEQGGSGSGDHLFHGRNGR